MSDGAPGFDGSQEGHLLRRSESIVLKEDSDSTPQDAVRPVAQRRGLGALRPESAAAEPKPEPVVEEVNSERWRSQAEQEPPPMSPEHRRNIERWRAEVLQSVAAAEDEGAVRGRWAQLLKPANIALLAVALVAGGTAAFLSLNQAPSTPGPAPVVAAAPEVVTQVIEEPTVQVLVAKTALTVGQRLTPGVLEWSEWPEDAARAEFFTQAAMPEAVTEMSGAVARYEFFPGEPIREAKLARADHGFLSAVLDPGTRAVAVQVSAESASGGFILPNDRVDVVLTTTVTNRQVSDTILKNVRVLAIDSRIGETAGTREPAKDSGKSDRPDEEAEEAAAPTTFASALATLALDPREAEVVIAATLTGRLSLVLRPTADVAAADTENRQAATNEAIRISSPFWAN